MVKLFKCPFSNSEMMSDAFPITYIYDDYVFKVKSSARTNAAMQFDIGDSEEVNDQDQQVNDIIDNFRYNQMTLSKTQFTSMIKAYLKKVSDRISEKKPGDAEYLKGFQTNMKEFVKMLLGKFSDLEFYMNDENDSEGAFVVGYWEDPSTDSGPTFFYLKDGLVEEKI